MFFKEKEVGSSEAGNVAVREVCAKILTCVGVDFMLISITICLESIYKVPFTTV